MAEAMGMSDNENASTLFFVMKTLTINLEEMASTLRATLSGDDGEAAHLTLPEGPIQTMISTCRDWSAVDGPKDDGGDNFTLSLRDKASQPEHSAVVQLGTRSESASAAKSHTQLNEGDGAWEDGGQCDDEEDGESDAFRLLSAQLERIERGLAARSAALDAQLDCMQGDLRRQEVQLDSILGLLERQNPDGEGGRPSALATESPRHSSGGLPVAYILEQLAVGTGAAGPTASGSVHSDIAINAAPAAPATEQVASSGGGHRETGRLGSENGPRRMCARDLPVVPAPEVAAVGLRALGGGREAAAGVGLPAAGLPHFEEWRRLGGAVAPAGENGAPGGLAPLLLWKQGAA